MKQKIARRNEKPPDHYRMISSYISTIITSALLAFSSQLQRNLTLQLLLCQIILVLIEIKESLRNRLSRRFVLWVVVRFQIWMFQSFLYVDPLDGIERKELLEQV